MLQPVIFECVLPPILYFFVHELRLDDSASLAHLLFIVHLRGRLHVKN